MFRSIFAAIVTAVCGACTSLPGADSKNPCDDDAGTAVAATVDAHGGRRAWENLESIYVE